MKNFLPVLTLLLSLPCWSQVTQNVMAEAQPQYEVGAGFIALNAPDYPGSDNNRARIVPFPYYIYRGQYLRADDEGTRARLISSRRFETGLSFGFNFPVNSGDNQVRQNMPDLDALFSFGPRLLYRLLTESKNHKLNLSFATRAVFSTKLSFYNLLRSEGFAFEPRINYWYRWQDSQTTIFSSFGVEFGTSKYASFFYDVPTQFQAPNRQQYTAKAGLIESSFSLGLGQSLSPHVFLFAGGSIRNLDWAANRESPLVAQKNNLSFILGLVWTFLESEEKVQRL